MTVFLVIGAIGLVLLLASVLLGDHVHGVFEVLDAGDWFTGAGFAAFLGALGFVGAIILDQTDNTILAAVVGALAGVGIGALVGWITIRLRGTSASDAPTQKALVGRSGVVISDIPAEGFGEVRLSMSGHLTKLYARADEAIPAGTEVWIVETLSATSVRVQATHT